MKAWERYEHQTAELLRELGFTAAVNDRIEEPNGTVHNGMYRRGGHSQGSTCSGLSSASTGTGASPRRRCWHSGRSS